MAELVYPPVVRFALGVFRALDLKLDVRGQEHVPPDGGAIVAINHVSYLDFALAGVPFWRAHRRLVRFMAKQEVFDHRIAGPLMRGMHHIPVDRTAGAGAYRAAVSALRRGELVGVFPEATISRSFCLKEFKSGAARMAVEADVPIVPVVVWGSQRVLTKGRKRDFRAARHTPVSITVGAPLVPADLPDVEVGTKALVAAMSELLADAQERYPVREPGDGWWLPRHLGGTAPTPEEAATLEQAETDERRARRARRRDDGPQQGG